MMIPVKVQGITPELIQRIAARAVQMQGMPEVHYGLLTAKDREGFARGTLAVLTALESLGFELLAPAELSPTLPHEREVG